MPPLVSSVAASSGGSQDPASRDISRVLPVFILSTLVERGAWPGPHSRLPARGLALGWAEVVSADAIQPVLTEASQTWDAQGIDWRARALENLRERSPQPLGGNGALFRDSGDTWLISLTCADGLGPSRLLLAREMAQIFPRGYRVALPERNRAFAFARELDREDLGLVEHLIERSYSKSDQPLSPWIFDPDDLLSAEV
jgi:hypothetical protein